MLIIIFWIRGIRQSGSRGQARRRSGGGGATGDRVHFMMTDMF